MTIAIIDKPEWAVNKEKYVRYKIFNCRQGRREPSKITQHWSECDGYKLCKPFKSSGSGRALFIYDWGDSLTFTNLTYCPGGDGKFQQTNSSWKVRCKNGKLNVL